MHTLFIQSALIDIIVTWVFATIYLSKNMKPLLLLYTPDENQTVSINVRAHTRISFARSHKIRCGSFFVCTANWPHLFLLNQITPRNVEIWRSQIWNVHNVCVLSV